MTTTSSHDILVIIGASSIFIFLTSSALLLISSICCLCQKHKQQKKTDHCSSPVIQVNHSVSAPTSPVIYDTVTLPTSNNQDPDPELKQNVAYGEIKRGV